MDRPPGDDDHGGEDSLTWAASFEIPDDISSLHDDIARWHQEEQDKARDERLPWRIHLPRRIRRYGITAPLIIFNVLVISAASAAMIIFGPGIMRPSVQTARPLASSPVRIGTVGGLVPDMKVNNSADGSPIDLRSLRPAVLTLVPANCGCETSLAHIAAAATPYGIQQYVVAADSGTLAQLQGSKTELRGLIDGGALRELYGGADGKPTIVVVAADGVVRAIETVAGSDVALNGYLDATNAGSFTSAS